jgi:succinate dehydrogenase / fumarate reductase cytochrome b subunit
MNARRPVYLNLLQIRQPVPAIVSILHRISGAILFLGIPVTLALFQKSLTGPEQFNVVRGAGLLKFGLFVILTFYGYHFFSGLRFLAFDLDRPSLFRYARASARGVLLLAGAFIIGIGIWLW